MPRNVVTYDVFIGSPRGLDEERRGFYDLLNAFNATHAKPFNVAFEPVGWEETARGQGAPQDRINEDLRTCDYAVFVLHDWWGSPTVGHSSGTEEEWEHAERLYKDGKIYDTVLYFKGFDKEHLRDLSPQINKVVEFREKIVQERRYFFRDYSLVTKFRRDLENHLRDWLIVHQATQRAQALLDKAFKYGQRNQINNEIECYDEIVEDLDAIKHHTFPLRQLVAQALFNKGTRLRQDERGDEAILAYDELVGRCSTALQPPLRKSAAEGLLDKARTLGQIDKTEHEIAAYDEVVERFGNDSELMLREQVAQALLNKGVKLALSAKIPDAISKAIKAYNAVVERFGEASEMSLCKRVAEALLNKGEAHRQADQSVDEIAAYDDLVARFRTRTDESLREQVAEALFRKCDSLKEIENFSEEIVTYEAVMAIFGNSQKLQYRKHVAKALVAKADTLDDLGRSEEAYEAFDKAIELFGTAEEPALKTSADQARSRRSRVKSHPLQQAESPIQSSME